MHTTALSLIGCVPLALPVLRVDVDGEHWQSQWHTSIHD